MTLLRERPMLPLAVTAYSVVCATGYGQRALLAALQDRREALTPNDFTAEPLPTWIGRVAGLEGAEWNLPARARPVGVPQQSAGLGRTQHR